MTGAERLKIANGMFVSARRMLASHLAAEHPDFGEPRFTNDIDIAVDLPPAKISAFCALFPDEDFYLSDESARRAVARRGQFNLIHPRSGLKVDFRRSADFSGQAGGPSALPGKAREDFPSPESRALQASQAVPAIPASRDNNCRPG